MYWSDRFTTRTSAASRQSARRRQDALPVSDLFPAVRAVEVDENGRIWVRRYARPSWESASWLGFDSAGSFRCAVTIPERFTVLQFGDDFILGRARGEFDAEYVEVYELRRTDN